MTVEKAAANQDHAEKVPRLSRLGDHDKTVSSSDEDIRGRMVKDKDGQDVGRIDKDVSISHTREHVAGAPRYDPDIVVADGGDWINLYPYYGYPGYSGMFPMTRGYPSATTDTTAAEESSQ
jgi:hypothetical protein